MKRRKKIRKRNEEKEKREKKIFRKESLPNFDIFGSTKKF